MFILGILCKKGGGGVCIVISPPKEVLMMIFEVTKSCQTKWDGFQER